MRKSFIYAAGLMCLALALTNCRKEQAEPATPASEPNFELFARPVTTKTANDGLDTKWVAKDAINVFHAEAGSATYVSDGQFTVKDTETGKFDGTVKTLDADKSYDWYAFYPYTSLIVSPDNTDGGYCYIGSRSDASQTQTGDNNMSHICGSNYPLYGIAKEVKASDVPSIQMQHLTSVIKIVVTNSTEEELSLNNVSFTAEENISGQFYIAFNGETPTYTSATYASQTAALTVSDVTVASNGKATVYMAIKPFTAKSGSTLKLAVNDYEKTLVLDKDVTFTAGSIKPLNFNYDKQAEDYSGTYLLVNSDKTKVCPSFTSGKNNIPAEDYDSASVKDSWVMTIDKVVSEGMYTIKDANGMYLSTGEAKNKNYLVGLSSADASRSYWEISSNSDGSFTIIATKSSYNNLLRYNSGSTLFACYSSGQNAITLVKYTDLPSLATPKVLAEVQDINSVYATWDEISGAKDYTVSCGDQKFTTTETEYTFTGLAYSTDYTVSVVANPSDATVNSPSAGKSETVTTGANPAGEEKVLIIDASQLTSTATTTATEKTYGGVTIVFSKGAKKQAVSGDNAFSKTANSAILIGKSGTYIYNKTAIPGVITKFEIFANKGASASVSVGVNFSSSAITGYSSSASNTYTATLSDTDKVYDCSSKLPADAKYFWYQVTNANNSQVQFRITYIE